MIWLIQCPHHTNLVNCWVTTFRFFSDAVPIEGNTCRNLPEMVITLFKAYVKVGVEKIEGSSFKLVKFECIEF